MSKTTPCNQKREKSVRADWGFSLGGVYQSGYFVMSTWIPFVWAVINTLVLIISSFAIYGGL